MQTCEFQNCTISFGCISYEISGLNDVLNSRHCPGTSFHFKYCFQLIFIFYLLVKEVIQLYLIAGTNLLVLDCFPKRNWFCVAMYIKKVAKLLSNQNWVITVLHSLAILANHCFLEIQDGSLKNWFRCE